MLSPEAPEVAVASDPFQRVLRQRFPLAADWAAQRSHAPLTCTQVRTMVHTSDDMGELGQAFFRRQTVCNVAHSWRDELLDELEGPETITGAADWALLNGAGLVTIDSQAASPPELVSPVGPFYQQQARRLAKPEQATDELVQMVVGENEYVKLLVRVEDLPDLLHGLSSQGLPMNVTITISMRDLQTTHGPGLFLFKDMVCTWRRADGTRYRTANAPSERHKLRITNVTLDTPPGAAKDIRANCALVSFEGGGPYTGPHPILDALVAVARRRRVVPAPPDATPLRQ